ncbi:hypothetical protein SERLA73DRAFT_68554 [Serpula lacrymans var. lacrymans S7.3]|uniref:Uncharacterized protein n=2 Tax=Serpula lacrymans var. lacrymans TaxID=341189 RepID=F8PGU2_SERL3|nr:uncharacterized protein SERLADRAFT_432320 [Serpula lacrymans var. lacrymans S7.9]EGO04894.1 hypothetical protein SERLA73DRAFT_68554 [Serpula lacrymans var. lacrymans S7.3]EGO30708.1 hypothetical protein SERLADRAFT_432320 [Serpula lacrymans var. lacrymans S7.9]
MAELSSVEPLMHDMCVNTYLAYTGPFANLDGEKKVSLQQFHTMPIGPQIQVLWCDSARADNMRYWESRTQELIEELELNDSVLGAYDDIFAGSNYLNAVADGHIQPNNPVPIFLMDGA